MRAATLIILLAIAVIAECDHMFIGTKPLVFHYDLRYGNKMFRKRLENFYFTLPAPALNAGRHIKAIMAHDLTDSGAYMNVMEGGIGFNFVNLRMQSDVGRKLHYDLYIYA